MKKIKSFFTNLWKNESGQGMTEYALLLVIIIAVAVIFKQPISNAIKTKMEEVQSGITGFNGN